MEVINHQALPDNCQTQGIFFTQTKPIYGVVGLDILHFPLGREGKLTQIWTHLVIYPVPESWPLGSCHLNPTGWKDQISPLRLNTLRQIFGFSQFSDT